MESYGHQEQEVLDILGKHGFIQYLVGDKKKTDSLMWFRQTLTTE